MGREVLRLLLLAAASWPCSSFFAPAALGGAARGVALESIAIDPGLGFGKTVHENLSLIAGTSRLVAMGHPLLVGASRKSFIGAITGESDPARRVAGSVALHLEASARGAQLLRVQDVAEHVQALAAWRAIRELA